MLQKIYLEYGNYSNKKVRSRSVLFRVFYEKFVQILALQHQKRPRGELLKNIDADYYGYMDDDDGLLVPTEERCEKEAIRKKIEEWKNKETHEAEMDEVYILPEMNVCSRKRSY